MYLNYGTQDLVPKSHRLIRLNAVHLAFLRKARFKRIHSSGDRLGFTQSGLLLGPGPSASSGARHLRNGTQPTWRPYHL